MRFGAAPGSPEEVAERPVVGIGPQEGQPAEVAYPGVADCARDCRRKGGVCKKQPATRRDSVSLVVEAVGEEFSKILDGPGSQQVRMNRGDAVRAVRADDRKVGHA